MTDTVTLVKRRAPVAVSRHVGVKPRPQKPARECRIAWTINVLRVYARVGEVDPGEGGRGQGRAARMANSDPAMAAACNPRRRSSNVKKRSQGDILQVRESIPKRVKTETSQGIVLLSHPTAMHADTPTPNPYFTSRSDAPKVVYASHSSPERRHS